MAVAVRGRPAKTPAPGERVSLGLKVTPAVKISLDQLARQNGRTQSQEAELRLEYSFRDESRAELFHEAAYGAQTAGLLELLGSVIRNAAVSSSTGLLEDWLDDPIAFSRVCGAIGTVLDALRPPGAGEDPSTNLGREIACGWLIQVATRHSPEDSDPLARFGRAVRARIGEAAARRIAKQMPGKRRASPRRHKDGSAGEGR